MQASLDLGQYNHMKLCQNKYDDSKVFSNHCVRYAKLVSI